MSLAAIAPWNMWSRGVIFIFSLWICISKQFVKLNFCVEYVDVISSNGLLMCIWVPVAIDALDFSVTMTIVYPTSGNVFACTRWVNKKCGTLLLSVSPPIIDWFSKFFHWHTLRISCNNAIIIYPSTPQICLYNTLWNTSKIYVYNDYSKQTQTVNEKKKSTLYQYCDHTRLCRSNTV